MRYWLMKSEPDLFSISDLRTKKRWHWDGVRNYQARNFMRDDMKIGDMVIFYHSSCLDIGPAGIATIDSLPYPDHTQFDKNSKYYDAKSTPDVPRWYMVDVAYEESFPNVISRERLRASKKLTSLWLWNRPRLSIIPLTKLEFNTIVSLAK